MKIPAPVIVLSLAFASWLGLVTLTSVAQDLTVPNGTTLPDWPKLPDPNLPPGSPSIRSSDLELVHARDAGDGFILRVAGQTMAVGLSRPILGYVAGGQVRWLDAGKAANREGAVSAQRSSLRVRFACTDADGARWRIEQRFSVGSLSGAIDVTSEVNVDHDRAVAFLPMLMVFPGAGTFGEMKGQGLFAGLEYLENEPSSSEADLIGPASKRQVPDSLKITFPLMAIQQEGRLILQLKGQSSVELGFRTS
jgi:hypothetical protein